MVLSEKKTELADCLYFLKLSENLGLVTSGECEKPPELHPTDLKLPAYHPVIKRRTLGWYYALDATTIWY